MAVNVTVTQNGNPPVDGTASWQNTNAPYIDGGGGISSVSDTCVADDTNSDTVACDASFQNSGSGTKTTFFHPYDLSQLQTCTEDDPAQFGGNPGTCTYADGSGEADIADTQVIGAGTQHKPSDPQPSTCTAPDTGTMIKHGTASYGTPYDVGTATTPVTSYTHDAWGDWLPETSTCGTTAMTCNIEQTRIRTTYESVSASTIGRQKDCDATSQPGCGGSVGTCTGGETAGTDNIDDGIRVVSPATGPTEVTPTELNMGLETRMQDVPNDDYNPVVAATGGAFFTGTLIGQAVEFTSNGGLQTAEVQVLSIVPDGATWNITRSGGATAVSISPNSGSGNNNNVTVTYSGFGAVGATFSLRGGTTTTGTVLDSFDTAAGSGGGGFPSFSNYKKNIVEVGTSPNGIPIYEFEYDNHDRIEAAYPGRYRGTMYEDVQHIEGATSLNNEGIGLVHYDVLDIDFERID